MQLSRIIHFAAATLLGLSILADGQVKKFSVGFDLPEERLKKDEVNLFIRVSDPEIRRISIYHTDLQKLTSHAVTDAKVVHTTIKLKDGKSVKLHIAGLKDDENVAEERQVIVPGYGEAALREIIDEEVVEANSKEKMVFVKPASAPVSDARYLVELRPRFQKKDGNPTKYVVELWQGGKLIDEYEHKVEWEKDDKQRPVDPVTIPVTLRPGSNRVRVRLKHTAVEGLKSERFTNTVDVVCSAPCAVLGRNINTRAIVGFEQTGASSAAGLVKPFVNFFISAPIGKSADPLKTPPLAFWTDFRLTSTAAQRFVDISKITTAFSNTDSSFATNEVVQSFRLNAGLDYRVPWGGDSVVPFFLPGKSSISVIAGVGISAPLSYQRETAAEIFRIPTTAEGDEGVPTDEFKEFYQNLQAGIGKKIILRDVQNSDRNIAFMQPERVRFYKRAFVGGRLKVDFWENHFRQMDVSPAIFDLTIGIDESIRKGYAPKVMNFEGFVPFPIGSGKYVYLYGGASVALTRNSNARIAPIYMERGVIDQLGATTTIVVPSVDNPFIRSSRDTYFFGVGIDFLELFRDKSKEVKP